MIVIAPGTVHLLGADLRAICGSRFGWLTTWVSRCTCPSCHAVWDHLTQDRPAGCLVTDDDSEDERGH